MRRISYVALAAALMVAMLVLTAMPAFAAPKDGTTGSGGSGGGGGSTTPGGGGGGGGGTDPVKDTTDKVKGDITNTINQTNDSTNTQTGGDQTGGTVTGGGGGDKSCKGRNACSTSVGDTNFGDTNFGDVNNSQDADITINPEVDTTNTM